MVDKVFLVVGNDGDFYSPEEIYAICTSFEQAELLKRKAENETIDCGTHEYKRYEFVEIDEVKTNEELE